MIATVYPGKLSGSIAAIPSKSHVHRQLICAALSAVPTTVYCPALNADIEATARCLNAMCADISYNDGTFTVIPAEKPAGNIADCGESGSTYRFLLPVAAALGTETTFRLHGRLPLRPMGELFSALTDHGVTFSGLGTPEVTVRGKLTGGTFSLPGDISSQYISALIFAAPVTGEGCVIKLTSPVESKGYIRMTLDAVNSFGVNALWQNDIVSVPAGSRYKSPGKIISEGDWSNAAFILCAAAAGNTSVDMTGLDPSSSQGDKAVTDIIRAYSAPAHRRRISLSDIPDLAPALAVLAASSASETVFTDAARLRLKESDRIAAICDTMNAIGANFSGAADSIIVRGGKPLSGGTVDSANDHRIAMMAVCSAVISEGPITILRAEAVNKSYPDFFRHIQRLGLRVDLS